MPIRNAHWYSRNETSAYPLDDSSTGEDDAGGLVPQAVIVDLNLRWPDSLGDSAFVAGVAVTASAVSVVIQSCTGPGSGQAFSPLASVSLAKPVVPGRQYPLDPQAGGVGGWVVFGDGVRDGTSYRGGFSTPAQSILASKSARAYKSPPVPGIAALGADPALSGVVVLRASPPLAVSAETREIDGVVRDCVVVRIDRGGDGFTDAGVFREFAGPCAGRPESQTCGDPQPIEFVNGIGPDCDGLLTLVFSGCAEISRVSPGCGVAVDCGLGLSDACLPPALPNADGLLPGEYDPYDVDPSEPGAEEEPGAEVSESVEYGPGLPYLECFGASPPVDFTTAYGLFAPLADATASRGPCTGEAYAYATTTAGSRCVAVWDGVGLESLGRRAEAGVKMTTGPAGAGSNGGLVFNYRPHASGDGRYVYFFASVDRNTLSVRISRFTGTGFQVVASAEAPGLSLDAWYDVAVTISPASGGDAAVTASFSGPGVSASIGPMLVANYSPSDGLFGVGTDGAISSFSHFSVEDA